MLLYEPSGNYGKTAMIIKTRIFQLCDGKYRNLSELARDMGLSVSQVYRVREGKRNINQKFLVGAKKVFPDYRLDELFYLADDIELDKDMETFVTNRYRHIVKQYANMDSSDGDGGSQRTRS